MSGRIETRLRELGHELPSAPAVVGAYVPAVRTGSLVATSGQLPFVGRQLAFVGSVGGTVTEEDGQNAAQICVLNALAQIRALVGTLDHVARIVRLEGFVQSAPGFHNQPLVLNGASNLLLEVFGDAGRHTRTAVGVSSLPLDATVEIALWVEVGES